MTTTGNPEKCGTCLQCGGQLYIGLTHGCTTGLPTSYHTPLSEIAQEEMSPFERDYLPDGLGTISVRVT